MTAVCWPHPKPEKCRFLRGRSHSISINRPRETQNSIEVILRAGIILPKIYTTVCNARITGPLHVLWQDKMWNSPGQLVVWKHLNTYRSCWLVCLCCHTLTLCFIHPWNRCFKWWTGCCSSSKIIRWGNPTNHFCQQTSLSTQEALWSDWIRWNGGSLGCKKFLDLIFMAIHLHRPWGIKIIACQYLHNDQIRIYSEILT